MSDLVRGGYPVTHSIRKVTGGLANATQANIAARSNAEFFGLASLVDAGALIPSAGCTSVPIPVEIGDVITKITYLIGASAATTPTHSFGALYSGVATPALLAQSVDGGAAAIAAGAAFTFTLASPVVVTATNAPNGYLYATVSITSSSNPSVAAVSVATAVGYKAFTNSPLFFSAQHGSGLTGTAPGTIVTPAPQAGVPIVFLT